jgi:transcriptional regulator GlxA family with amidase domain
MDVDSRIAWALAEMARRFRDLDSVDELAAGAHLSRSRFAHLFKQHTGVASGRYLRDMRLEHARTLLETTFLSVKEVMAAVGINDPSHFSRDFQTRFGVSPREWRKRVLRATDGLEVASSAK